jgi:CMP-N-acetylneuraminic acid synthetase
MKVLAIIPARGGSKRIPKKNIKNFLGKPLIEYAIKSAQKSGLINKILVSTDSLEIKKIAKKLGAESPFIRPKYLSGDVPTEKVVLHAVKYLKKKFNEDYDLILTLEPPAIARNDNLIRNCINFFKKKKNNKYDSYITVVKISERPEWMLKIKKNKINYIYPKFFYKGKKIFKFPSSKNFETVYKVIGIIFAIKNHALFKYKSCVGLNCYPKVLKKEFDLDLDWPADWKVAEKKIKLVK